jgi:hypothetical protein
MDNETDEPRNAGRAPGQERRCKLQAITGVFLSREDAERVFTTLRTIEDSATKISLLTPGDVRNQFQRIAVDAAQPPGRGKALGGVAENSGGRSTGATLTAFFLPGVGWVTGAGQLAVAILKAAGAAVGAGAGESLEDAIEGLPEEEIFVYEDALRKGRSLVIALAADGTTAEPIRQSFRTQGGDAIDAARQEWWIGLRDAEREHYAASGRNFTGDEKFYRLGFEAALHARTRCKEFDQVSAEMASKLEDLQQQYPDAQIEEPFTRGYERGREHFQALCDERAA